MQRPVLARNCLVTRLRACALWTALRKSPWNVSWNRLWILSWTVAVCASLPARAVDGASPQTPTTTSATTSRSDADSNATTQPEEGDDPSKPQEATASSPAPLLNSVDFEGRVYFKDETLRAKMRHPIPGALDEELLHDDARLMASEFRERGYLQASVDVKLRRGLLPTQVHVTFVIHAGERAELRSVQVVGNQLVDEASLKDGFFSRPPEPLGLLSRAGLFHRPYLDQDGQRLVYNYYKRGFLEARVVDTRVQATPDLAGIGVIMTVVEGPLYELAALRFEGDVPTGASNEEMRSAISIRDGDNADLVSIQQQADVLLDPLRNEGFAFARFEQQVGVVDPPSKRVDRRGVTVTLRFVRGPHAVVDKVRIVGSHGTQDHVIRRDIVVVEGASYDHQAARRSERQLLATGFFSQVTAKAVPAAGTQGGEPIGDEALVDVEVSVTEIPTWLLSPAIIGDANEGIIFMGLLGDRNLLGTGLSTMLSVQLSGLRQLFDFSLTEPRVLDTKNALSLEVHRREYLYRDFRIRSDLGGSARATIPFDLGISVGGRASMFAATGIGIEYGGVAPFKDKPVASSDLLPQEVLRNTVEVRAGFDSRDSVLSPRNGIYLSAEVQGAGPWSLSGVSYVDGELQLKLFWTPIFQITLKSNTQVGIIGDPLGGTPPVTDRFFLGGLGTIRGFFPRSIGPVANVPLANGGSIEAEVGGVVKFVQNAELEFPLWPQSPFRGFVFYDFGNTWGELELAHPFDGEALGRDVRALPLGMFMSVGGGVLIETPVLPFRIEWSVPLTRRSLDQPVNFFLGIGSAF